MKEINKNSICSNCGHYYFLHDMLNGECNACDSPEISMEKKCPEFKIEELEKRITPGSQIVFVDMINMKE